MHIELQTYAEEKCAYFYFWPFDINGYTALMFTMTASTPPCFEAVSLTIQRGGIYLGVEKITTIVSLSQEDMLHGSNYQLTAMHTILDTPCINLAIVAWGNLCQYDTCKNCRRNA